MLYINIYVFKPFNILKYIYNFTMFQKLKQKGFIAFKTLILPPCNNILLTLKGTVISLS